MFLTPTLRTLSYSPALHSIDRSFERFLGDATQLSNRASQQLSQQFSEDETSWSLSLDLPGIPKEQLTISIEGTALRIASADDAARKVALAYEFPQDIDAAQSKAKLENGVLTLTLAKKVPQSTASTLTIS